MWIVGLVVTLGAATPAFTEEPKPQESMGPLKRFDPVLEKLPGLIDVYGKPRRGLPLESRRRMQRMAKQDKWCVEANGCLVVMEWNPQSFEMETREAITAWGDWCLSPDGMKLLTYRLKQSGSVGTTECFDLRSGKSLWTCEVGMKTEDSIFTLDSKQVVILHSDKGGTLISWYDPETGERKRRVTIPGEIQGRGGNYLGLTSRSLFVTIPREDHLSEGWVIQEGNDEPAKIAVDQTPSATPVQIEVGGARRELLAMYSEDVVEIFREEDGNLTRLRRIELTPPPDGNSYSKSVRFSPDYSQLFVATSVQTWVISIQDTPQTEIKEFPTGLKMFDFTLDGKHLLSVNDGGGAARNPATIEREDSPVFKKEPTHCCPIVDAGFSMNGRMIVSNDHHKIILWTNEGKFLAELVSPNEKKHKCIEMQSVLFVDRTMKVFAADGYNFLEWDLREIGDRAKGPEGISLGVEGKVAFPERVAGGSGYPQAMNISLDSSETNLIVATPTVFRSRPMAEPEAEIDLPVPKDDIFMKPRYVYQQDQEPRILVASAKDMWMLDPAGKEQAIRLSYNFSGFDPKAKCVFQVVDGKERPQLNAVPFGMKQQATEVMQLPAEWKGHACSRLLVSKDSRWIVACHGQPGRTDSVAVIDWEQKKIVRDFPLNWMVTSMAFSPDDSRLLIGSFNRCVYHFDFSHLRTAVE